MRGRRVEVGKREEGVRRRLEPDEIRAGRRRARLVELDDRQPPAFELLEEEPDAVVRPLRDRDGLAGLEQAERRRRRGRHARCEEERVPALELAERLLRGDAGRMRVPHVGEFPLGAVRMRPDGRAIDGGPASQV